MKRLFTLVAIATFAAGALGVTGCVVEDDPAVVTCDAFDSYLLDCYPECQVTWDCEAGYDAQYVDTQIDLDDCSDCLDGLAASGVCGDCTYAGGYSCQDLLYSTLGVDCAW